MLKENDFIVMHTDSAVLSAMYGSLVLVYAIRAEVCAVGVDHALAVSHVSKVSLTIDERLDDIDVASLFECLKIKKTIYFGICVEGLFGESLSDSCPHIEVVLVDKITCAVDAYERLTGLCELVGYQAVEKVQPVSR